MTADTACPPEEDPHCDHCGHYLSAHEGRLPCRFATIDPTEWPDTGLRCRFHPHMHLRGGIIDVARERLYLIHCSACGFADHSNVPPAADDPWWLEYAIFPEGWRP